MIKAVFGGLALAVLLGCQYDPYAHEYTHSKPTVNELSGRYEFDSETIQLLQKQSTQGIPNAILILRPNGSFTASNIPACWRSEEINSGTPESAEGDWVIEKHQEWWSVKLRCTKINGLPMQYSLTVMVRNDAPPHVLHITIGDPDSGEALAFERRGNAT